MNQIAAKPPAHVRADLRRIADWIEPGSRVLDLGCGDGTLARAPAEQQAVRGCRGGTQRSAGHRLRAPRRARHSAEPGRGPGAVRRPSVRHGGAVAHVAVHAQHRAYPARNGAGCEVRHRIVPQLRLLAARLVDSAWSHAGHGRNAISVVRHTQHSPVHPARFRRPGASLGLRITDMATFKGDNEIKILPGWRSTLAVYRFESGR